jgi:hypothetical protein
MDNHKVLLAVYEEQLIELEQLQKDREIQSEVKIGFEQQLAQLSALVAEKKKALDDSLEQNKKFETEIAELRKSAEENGPLIEGKCKELSEKLKASENARMELEQVNYCSFL